MIVGYVDKQPAETFPVSVDFTNELVSPETVTGATVTSKRVSDGADTTATICNGAPAVITPIVAQQIRAGADGETHILTFRPTTSAGNTYEHEVALTIKEVATLP